MYMEKPPDFQFTHGNSNIPAETQDIVEQRLPIPEIPYPNSLFEKFVGVLKVVLHY